MQPMNNDNLVKMANNIAAFFNSDPDREAAVEGVSQHIQNFWEPRMKKAILAHAAQGGAGLDELVLKALTRIE